MTMENKPTRIAIMGEHRMPIAAALLAAHSHCLGSPCSVIDEPIEYKLSDHDIYTPELKMLNECDPVKASPRFKKSRSKYSPVEEDRKHNSH